VLRDAGGIDGWNDVLDVERWASNCLGRAWVAAPLGKREPERELCEEVAGRACRAPSRHGLAAVCALRRVAPESEHALLDEAVELLAGSQPVPSWHAAPSARARRAWRAVDVWDSERVLFVEYRQPGSMTGEYVLMARVLDVAGTMVDRLGLLRAGVAEAWPELREPDEVPMPLAEVPVEDALADLADALRSTDMIWPRVEDEDVVELRSLAWRRCRGHLPDWPDVEPLPEDQREELIEAFMKGAGLPDAAVPDADVAASLADVFLDYGDGYLHDRPLGWSPTAVMLLLADWLPRKVTLDREQRAALPEVLRRWVRFALERRGVAPEWIVPVVAAVDEHLPAFTDAVDDESAWGPAKQIVTELAGSGVDLTDRAAVEQALRTYNAEQLARRLIDP
jgi:hypothetical protein